MESHDKHGREGHAGSFQSHSRVWPLTGALHFGRGQLIHTYTHLTHGECFAYRARECVCVGAYVCDVCIWKKEVERRGSKCFLLSRIPPFVCACSSSSLEEEI